MREGRGPMPITWAWGWFVIDNGQDGPLELMVDWFWFKEVGGFGSTRCLFPFSYYKITRGMGYRKASPRKGG